MSPVTVMKTSPILAASCIGMTWKPSMTASSAFDRVDFGDDDLGAQPRARMATPRPHQP